MYLLHAGNATFSFRIWRIAFLSIRWHYLKYSSIRIFNDPYSTVREKTRQWKLVFWHYWYRVKKCFWYHKTRSSRPKMFFKKCVFENFAKFTRKHLFFLKKKRFWYMAQVFSWEFCEIFKNTLFYRTLLLAASHKSKTNRAWNLQYEFWLLKKTKEHS